MNIKNQAAEYAAAVTQILQEHLPHMTTPAEVVARVVERHALRPKLLSVDLDSAFNCSGQKRRISPPWSASTAPSPISSLHAAAWPPGCGAG